MKVLPLILTLLIILSIALQEELRNYLTSRGGQISFIEQIANFRESKWEAEQKKEILPSAPVGGLKSSNIELSGGNSLPRELNIYALVDPEAYDKSQEQVPFLLRTVEKLMHKQFQNAPFFQTLIESDPQLISHLFEAIREKVTSTHFKIGKMGWKELSLIKLDNEQLQILLYEILKGEKIKGEKMDKTFQKGEEIPLLNAIRVEKGNKPTRLFTSSPTLLEALTSNEYALLTLLEKRRTLAKELKNLSKKNPEILKERKEALQKQWEEAAKEAGIDLPKTQFSYDLSTTPF